MKKSTCAMILALLLALGAAAPVSAGETTTGVFELKVKGLEKQLVESGLDKLAVIRGKEGLVLAARADRGQLKVLGTFKKDGTANVPLALGEKTGSVLKISESNGGKFSGTLTLDGQQLDFTASALGGVYLCGNHPKPHAACDPQQLMQLTQLYGCAQWKLSTVGEAKPLELSHIANLQTEK